MIRFMQKKTPTPNLSEMTHAEKDALILALLERLAALENRVSKDSHNSNNAPSSDGPQRRPKSLKPNSGAKVGGQIGHPGATLKQSLIVNHTIIHPLPLACDVCGAFLAGQASTLESETRQVIDLPPIRFEVTEHRIVRVQCTCGAQHCSAFPIEIKSAVQYGAGVRAASVYFTQYQQLPYKRCADAFRDLFGIGISAASMVNFTRIAGHNLTPAVACIAEAIVIAPVTHFDETGMRVGKKLTWLHSASTASMTWYGHHAKRGEAAMNDFGILPRYHGVAVHDGWLSYRRYSCLHALCNAHHLRELLYVFESTQQQWARDMMHLLCAAKDEMAARDNPDTGLSTKRCTKIRKAYAALIERGMAVTGYQAVLYSSSHSLGTIPSRSTTRRGEWASKLQRWSMRGGNRDGGIG
jgi:transposase